MRRCQGADPPGKVNARSRMGDVHMKFEEDASEK